MRELNKKIDGLKHEYEVLVEQNEIENKINQELTKLGNRVKLPGFRPGHIPLEILQKNYRGHVEKEAIEDAVKEAVINFITEKGLNVPILPATKILSIDKNGAKISIACEIMPEVSPKDSKNWNFKLKRYNIKAKDSEIKKYIDDIISNHVSWKEKQSDSIIGDQVVIDLEKIVKKSKKKKLTKNIRVVLGNTEFVEAFWKNLVGLKPGDEKEFSVETAIADSSAKHIDTFKAYVKQVLSPNKFSMNDEFAVYLGLKSKDEIEGWVRERLERGYNEEARRFLKSQILDLLLEKYEDFAVPQGMVELEKKEIMRVINEEAKREGKKLSEKKMPNILKECDEMAVKRVKLGLLVANFSLSHDIKVSSQEIYRAAMEIAYLYPGREAEVIEYYTKDRAMMSMLAGPILEEKVVAYILDKYCQFDDVEISKEEFDVFDNDVLDCYDDDTNSSTVSSPEKSKKKTDTVKSSKPLKENDKSSEDKIVPEDAGSTKGSPAKAKRAGCATKSTEKSSEAERKPKKATSTSVKAKTEKATLKEKQGSKK